MMAKSENTTGTLAQEPPGGAVAIALTGGGARAAYQVGLLRCLAEMVPDYRFRIVTGVSAGAINAAFLASHPGGLGGDVMQHGPTCLVRNDVQLGSFY